jgi:hypothetical protein
MGSPDSLYGHTQSIWVALIVSMDTQTLWAALVVFIHSLDSLSLWAALTVSMRSPDSLYEQALTVPTEPEGLWDYRDPDNLCGRVDP